MTVQSIASTDEYASQRPRGAELELLVATLDRAVLDYHSSRNELRRDAEEWLYDPSELGQAFSFMWVCDNLGLSPSAVLKRIEELNFSKTVSQRHRWLRRKIQSRDHAASANFPGNSFGGPSISSGGERQAA